jgi:hypothetical protein
MRTQTEIDNLVNFVRGDMTRAAKILKIILTRQWNGLTGIRNRGYWHYEEREKYNG